MNFLSSLIGQGNVCGIFFATVDARPLQTITMALEKYKAKRSADKTPEPFGGKGDKTSLRFVIQKHAASHLHYDFRLEMDGVLKSWAVPKGPSTDPDVKRLAMMVEDHPYDYRNFEGIIPQGQYGGGTVIVWDEGTYESIDDAGKAKKDQEKGLLKNLKAGKIKFTMRGQKLKGDFALVKAHGRGENGWLLMKIDDKYASVKDITLKDKSVQSGKTLEKVAASSDNIYGQSKEKKLAKKSAPVKAVKAAVPKKSPVAAKKTAPVKKAAVKKKALTDPKEDAPDVADILKKAKAAKIPTGMKPMLATLVDKPFDDEDWVYEIKWDGYRALAFIQKGKVELISRNNKSFNEKFYPITDLLKKWKLNVVLDGEIVVLGAEGQANFNALQNWRSEADAELAFYVFDILWYEGKNLMDLPLSQRQAILQAVLPLEDDRIRISQVVRQGGIEFFEAAKKMNLEGIMAKRADSLYAPDVRTKEWLKIKANKRQEVVIGGFTKNDGTAKQFSSLLLGVYENKQFRYVGKVGTGFPEKLQKEMMAMFKPYITKKSPFTEEPDYNKPSRFRPNPPNASATWLKPELVCEVSFAEITEDGVFRHPSFEGMREDKKAGSVIRETEASTKKTVKEAEKTPVKESTILKAPTNKNPKTLLNPTDETQVRIVSKHELKFTNLSKLYWPKDGFTKRDMLNYYYQAAEFILPYLKDRPQSLNRFPNGIDKPSFYQKDVKGKSPDWIKKFPYTTSDGEEKEYLVGGDEASLMWMASLGCIEMNPWFSRVQTPDNPDYCIIDLDPDKNTFDQVIEAALETKKILDALDIPSFCKTSGSTGIHIYIPLNAKYSYDQSQLFGRLVVTLVHQQLPDFTSMERAIKNRKGKMYLDFLQNRPGATIACPYSLRPKPGATVSMPLHWEEVKPGLTMKHFTIDNSIARMKKEGDIFKGVLGKGINLEKALKKAQELF
ncbi:MAG: ligase [Ferruginibacter sp.]|nr:ligase [Ferruginibacter sp.]